MERGGDEGRRATAHNVSSVAGGGPAMMWHCSDPPHVFFGPLCLLLHPSHAAPPWDGPSPSPHPPPPPPPTARPPMSPGTEQALAVFPTWPCHITHKGAFQSATRGTSGLRFPRLPAGGSSSHSHTHTHTKTFCGHGATPDATHRSLNAGHYCAAYFQRTRPV